MDWNKKTPRFLYGYHPADNFNVEQQYYNKYFSERLIDHRPEPEPQPVTIDSVTSDSTQAKKPFFKGLFKKRNKQQVTDSLSTQTDPALEGIDQEEGNE